MQGEQGPRIGVLLQNAKQYGNDHGVLHFFPRHLCTNWKRTGRLESERISCGRHQRSFKILFGSRESCVSVVN